MSFECRGDRVLEARRGQLTSALRLAQEAHVRSCESCRLLLEIGADFDELAAPSWDDGARIERLAARLVAAHRPTPRKRLLRVTAFAACILLFTGLAAAAALGVFARRAPALVASVSTLHARSVATLPKPFGSVNAIAPQTPLAQPSFSAPAIDGGSAPNDSLAQAALPAQIEAHSSRVAVPPPSAAQVFRSANDARRSGQAQKAIKLYRALQRDYPSSREAALSLVSLGSLLVSADALGAIEQFDRYLVASPNGAVVAEALYGRGRALQALGRTAEERGTWQELLARYPSSPYRDRALRRLAELQ